ncbi:hypothetical protein PHSC3_000901 [Chlamydiales bacterium STE3]|nr:hypothetical protein PHSC3_000901 [Chlamydiales bacterium STE3]
MRFDDKTIERFEKSAWWKWSIEKATNNLDSSAILMFINKKLQVLKTNYQL